MIEILLVFVFQSLFVFFHTLYICYVSAQSVWRAILVNAGIAVSILVSMAIGADSVHDMVEHGITPDNAGVVIAYLGGATLGTYIGMKIRK